MRIEKGSRSGVKITEYIYDTQAARKPILEIIKSFDRDGDGIPETEKGNAKFIYPGKCTTTEPRRR